MNSGNCQIKQHYYSTITNTGFFALNRGNNSSILVDGSSTIDNFINYGQIETTITLSGTINHLTNYGTMEGISVPYNNHTPHIVTIENYGVINPMSNGKKYHFNKVTLRLQAYAMRINVDSATFNGFDGNAKDNSHLVLKESKGVSFADKNSKLILDFGSGFELGKGYSLSKLIVDTDGNSQMSVDLAHLTTRTSLYRLTQSGDNFIVSLDAPNSEIGILHKANIRTMNNFLTISNSMIFPRKLYHSQNLGKKNQSNLVILRERSDRRISKNNIRDSSPKAQNDNIMLDSAIPLKSYESFAYRNESINRRIQRQNKRNYNRKSQNQTQNLKENQRNLQNLNTDSVNKTNQNNSSLRASEYERGNPKNQSTLQNQNTSQNLKENQRTSQNLAQSPNYSQTPHNYYFILTPFFNHNSFAKSGNYNLNGFDYGFLTAFSAQVAESNSLGAHFIFSYGDLGDKKDKDLSIKSLNLNVGINYKLDLIYDMYLKARGDFYYFLNQVKTLTMLEAIKPNNLGFGVSVSYGKDFNFGKGGILGIEVGLDYKALQSSKISLQNNATKTISETYQKSLYNLIYADLGMNYSKYFGNFGLNAMLGIKGNITANKLATSKIHISTFNKNVDMVLDNDNFFGYVNLGASYVLNHKNFDMEFSLAYYGNFGDRVISNGGGVEWRVLW